MSSLPKSIDVELKRELKATIPILLISTVAVICMFSQVASSLEYSPCRGGVNLTVICEFGEIARVRLNGSNLRTRTSSNDHHEIIRLPQFSPQQAYSGENGLTIQNERHHIHLVPAGKHGLRIVYAYDHRAETPDWESIAVHCPPLSLIYRESRDQLVGHCDVNTTYDSSGRSCVPYFRLSIENGKWKDNSPTHLCSEPLHSTDLTTPVIIKFDSDTEPDRVMLYFAEQRTRRLHAVHLSKEGASVHTVDDDAFMIKRLIRAINDTFTGLLVTFYVNESPTLYHKLFSVNRPEHEFVGQLIRTHSVVFTSFKLDYYVTFNINGDKVVIDKNGTKTLYPLLTTLDRPIQCQNMAGSKYHYLVCLSGGGFKPLLINITINDVADQLIPFSNSKIAGFGRLTPDIFYLYTIQQEAVVYFLESTVKLLKTYSFCGNESFVLTDGVSDIKCNDSTTNVDHDGDADSDDDNNYVVPVITTIVVVVAICIAIITVVICLYNRCRQQFHEYTSPRVDHLVYPEEPPMVTIGLNTLVEAKECSEGPDTEHTILSKDRHVPDGRE